jgi:hypothetical protein
VLVAVLVSYVVGGINPTGVRFAEEPNSGFEVGLRGDESYLRVRKSCPKSWQMSSREIRGWVHSFE